jgi:hypothetical protein
VSIEGEKVSKDELIACRSVLEGPLLDAIVMFVTMNLALATDVDSA